MVEDAQGHSYLDWTSVPLCWICEMEGMNMHSLRSYNLGKEAPNIHMGSLPMGVKQ